MIDAPTGKAHQDAVLLDQMASQRLALGWVSQFF